MQEWTMFVPRTIRIDGVCVNKYKELRPHIDVHIKSDSDFSLKPRGASVTV